MAIPFLNNIIVDDAGHIQFKTAAGANAGKIDQSGDDLVLSNAVGDIIIGNGSDDVYIGDGTNAVDIRFEQNMAIYADSSSTRTLTLGGANTSLVLESPTISGTMTLGATTINNKLTFTTANGYILFDYEPSGDTGEYTTEVPLLKVDLNGSESTILARVSEYRAVVLGVDDTVWLRAGDTGPTIKSNVSLSSEQVLMSAEGGFIAYGFPGNDTSWSNRNEFQFRTDSTTASDNGLYIGDGSRTQFIDLSRNLKNIGTISNTGDITITNGNIIFSSQYGARFNDANTRIYTNTDSPEDLIIEADQDLLLTPDGQVNVHSNLVLSSNSYVASARKFTARDSNGVMLTADDAASGLSIADDGKATFTSNITAGPSATSGGRILSQTYTSADRLGVISSHASSGNLLIGYGAEGKTGASGDFVSTYGNFSGGHSALSISGTHLRWYSEASNSTTAVGNDLTLANVFSVDRSGNVALSGTVDGVDIAALAAANTGTNTGDQDLSSYAPLASPTFTGTPAAPTASAGTNTTQIATTAFVSTAVSNLVDSAPGTLNTLNELAAALGDDANFSTTVTNSIATKLPLAGGTMTGTLNMDGNSITFDDGSITSNGIHLLLTATTGGK